MRTICGINPFDVFTFPAIPTRTQSLSPCQTLSLSLSLSLSSLTGFGCGFLCLCHDLMSFSAMGFSCEDDFDEKGNKIPLINEDRDTRPEIGVDVRRSGVQNEVEFWPIEYPTEPLEDDQPVECPMLSSSAIHQEQFSNSFRKRPELSTVVCKERTSVLVAKPHAQAARKRRHGLTLGRPDNNSFVENATSAKHLQNLNPDKGISDFVPSHPLCRERL